jgi:hypothetical protein
MYYLNLPRIPENLVTKIRLESNLYKKPEGIYTSFDIPEIFKNAKEIENIYSKYFDEKISSELFVMKNNTETLNTISPHFDRERKIAVNYIIDTGEKNVKTVFYNKFRDDNEFENNNKINVNFDSKDLTIDKSYVIETNKWHCFNSQIAHGVENIEVYRVIVILFLVTDMNFTEFLKKYNKYVINKV